jgi:hypothetical protein
LFEINISSSFLAIDIICNLECISLFQKVLTIFNTEFNCQIHQSIIIKSGILEVLTISFNLLSIISFKAQKSSIF